MNPLETQFHRAQSRIKTAKRQAVLRGRQHEAPTFSADVLCGIDTKHNRERWLEYQSKLANREVAA